MQRRRLRVSRATAMKERRSLGVGWRAPSAARLAIMAGAFQDGLRSLVSPAASGRMRRKIAAFRRRERFFDDLMARTMICAASEVRLAGSVRAARPASRRAPPGPFSGARAAKDLRAWGRHLVRLCAVGAGLRPLAATSPAYLCAGQSAGQSVTGLRPFPFSRTTCVRARWPSRAAAAASPTGLRRPPAAAARAAPQRVPHGKQDADRRLPPGVNPGGS